MFRAASAVIWRLSSPGTDPSYAGPEWLIRDLRGIGLNVHLPQHLRAHHAAGAFGAGALCRVLLGLIVVGGRGRWLLDLGRHQEVGPHDRGNS